MRCDNILIVAKISRAITDRSLQSSLFSVFSRHVPQEWEETAARGLNIAVVCTKSDVSEQHLFPFTTHLPLSIASSS